MKKRNEENYYERKLTAKTEEGIDRGHWIEYRVGGFAIQVLKPEYEHLYTELKTVEEVQEELDK
jgi:hypothetical protein